MRLRVPSLVCLVVVAAAAVSGGKDPKPIVMTREEEVATWDRLSKILPPSFMLLPPGKGLCRKTTPPDQCTMRPGGGKGISKRTSRTLVKRLKKRGWIRTEKLPKYINSIHFCCNGKKFAMMKKPERPERVGPPPPLPFRKETFDTATVVEGEGEYSGWHGGPLPAKEIHGQLGLQDLLEMSYERGPIEPIVTRIRVKSESYIL